MKFKNLLLIIFFTAFSFLNAADDKKSILVLCSNGGFCHNAAAETLKKLIGDCYNIQVTYPIDEIHFLGVKSGEGIYNTMLRNDWIEPLNLVSKHVAPKMFRSTKKKLESIISRQIESTKPDLVISLIPYVNLAATEAARKAQIPYLLVTMDDDLQFWVHGLQSIKHPDFKMTIGANLKGNRSILKQRKVPEEAVREIGFPIRTDFMALKDKESIRKEFGISKDKPVALIILGGVGGGKTLKYAKTIASSQLGLHLIVCAGKNKKLAGELKKIKVHPTNALTVMEFTTRISDLMAISDLLITKPGSGTFHEAMQMQLPILADATSAVLNWEKTNIDLIHRYRIGGEVRNFDELDSILRSFLFDRELQKQIKDSYQKVPENRFNESIIPLIASMVNSHEA